MPTLKQLQAAQKTVKNGGNVTRAMLEAGYAPATVNNPSNLTKSKGFRTILEKAGLTENLVATALVEDIKNKPQNRSRELALASDILGLRQTGTTLQQANINAQYHISPQEFLSNPIYQEAVKRFEDDLKKLLIQKP